MAENIWVSIILVGGTILTLAYTILAHKRNERDSVRPAIEGILNDFVQPAIIHLAEDRYNCTRFDFPQSLNLTFGVSITGQAYNRFSRRKRILNWRISRYNNFCNKINVRISSMTALAVIAPIVHNVIVNGGSEIVLLDQYENNTEEQLNDLLEQNNLLGVRREIEKLQGRLPNKANKLITKLRKLIRKWEDRYNIV